MVVAILTTSLLGIGAGQSALAADFNLVGLLQTLLKPATAPAAPAPARLEIPASLVVADDSYLRPIEGEMLSGFGPRSDGMHTGMDIRGATGTPIRATRKGVILSGPCGSGYGTCSMIDHGGGITSLYAHMSRKQPNIGLVDRGQVIGYVGCTGSCETPQLHFEIRQNGVRKDPAGFLTPG